MKKLMLCAVAALVIGSASIAGAACTPEEAQSKALNFAQAVQTMSQQNPTKYAEIMQELQPELLKLQQQQDLDALCEFYDEALEKLK